VNALACVDYGEYKTARNLVVLRGLGFKL
jgi:hypothetical protein